MSKREVWLRQVRSTIASITYGERVMIASPTIEAARKALHDLREDIEKSKGFVLFHPHIPHNYGKGSNPPPTPCERIESKVRRRRDGR